MSFQSKVIISEDRFFLYFDKDKISHGGGILGMITYDIRTKGSV